MTNTEAIDILKKFVMGEYDGTRQALDEAVVLAISALEKDQRSTETIIKELKEEMFQEFMQNTSKHERRTEHSTLYKIGGKE